MQEATCNHCGASVILSAKFCRQCGNRLDESEMTTRSLDAPGVEPPPFDHPTRPANAGFTSPTYPPAVVPPVIGSAPPSNNKTALIVILGILMALLIGGGVIAFVVFDSFSRRPLPPPSQPPPVTSEKAPPPPPGQPGLIPHPPTPAPPPPPGSVKSTLDASLIYPGSEVTMEVASPDGGVTQLHTTADIDKVVDWYVEKIKPKKHVNMPGGVLLDGEPTKVLIMSTGDGTSIQVIHKGKDSD